MNVRFEGPSPFDDDAVADDDADIAAIFHRTRASGPPTDVLALADAVRDARAGTRGARTGRAARFLAVAAAAAALLVSGIAVGLLVERDRGTRADKDRSSIASSELDALRRDLAGDVARLLGADRAALLDDQALRLKEVAVLLRREYSAELAKLRRELDVLAAMVRDARRSNFVSFMSNRKENSR